MIDPNVFVSAAISPSGTTGRTIRADFEGRYRLVVCPHLVAELETVLHRPSFRRYLSVDQASELIVTIEAIADTEPDPEDVPVATRDPDDDYLLALAVAANADLVVSGDDDLSAIDKPPVEVIKPREFLDRLHGRHE